MQKTVLDKVRVTLQECNAVRSERQFCEEWLGKSESYLRGLRFACKPPSTDTLATCAFRLRELAEHVEQGDEDRHRYWGKRFRTLERECWQALNAQIATRLRTASKKAVVQC